MKKTIGTAMFVMFVLGCGSNRVDDSAALAKEACACANKECAARVSEKFANLLKQGKPSDKDAKRIMANFAEAVTCLAKLR